uniref:Baculoviral IAP repeat-containing protein 1 isoform X1 n=1 Tax=Camelus bactrianus TaxID=9837 RepID=A0A9W3HCZ0_CAMBA|nr:baculoviral IAP repeat-containing protein 1 isoform X1 [Camelus bactrianus]XP_010947621.1 baculoviral IAP repeat-containing protein 1 isoform X1 [Camelus bactrianus]XP_045368339.1 baculoviral IAP repeat-containing protein 1 isoform X1 [Camelus bactrianus]
MAAQEKASDERISQFDYALLQELSALLGIDASQLAKEIEKGEQKDREKMQKGFNSQMRSEAKRLKTFVTYESYSSWTPQEMAAAGFYFTGVKSGVQCFCCSLILFGTSLRRLPMEDHKKLRPDCEFLLGKDVGNIAKYDIRVKNPENKLRGDDKARYQEEKARLESFKNWPFYAQGTSPRKLSAAGFVFTGKRDTVRCFSCGGCLGNWEEDDDPWKEHAKWFPKCEFLQCKKTSEEIIQYIQSYKGFVGVTGEHFVNSWIKRALPMASAYCNGSIFANEELRLDSFKNWPQASPVGAAALTKAGFFYTGIKDTVQCFSCGGCLKKWEEGDDLLDQHTRCFPNCQFLQNMKSSAEVIPDLQSHGELSELTETTSESNLEDSAAVSSVVPEMAQGEAQWFREAKSLSERLRKAYTNARFCHMALLEVSSCPATDQLLGCDLSLASKHISSPMREPVVLPEVFATLNSVMCVEGEVGSGKTVLLKEIALLWASGCCPLLNRFQLVFYLSLSSTRLDQGLADIISDQLPETEGSVTEMGLRNIIQQLKNQVLLLLDDYKEMCSVPQVIERLIQKNHLSRTCLLIAVHTNRAKNIRRYLDTVLEIKAFPFYNTIYVLRKLFSHNMTRLQNFMIHFRKNENLQGIQKTPLFVAAVCANWLQYPFDESFDDVTVFKSYMKCLFLKNKTEAELLRATVSSCGELALRGFFSSCSEFSDDDLIDAGIDEDLAMFLMSKFTAQRLRPIYRFLNPAFQEFLAGMRLTELLDSDKQEDQDLGLYYLKQINSSLMAVCPYENFLNYVSCHTSTKAGPKIVSHLLLLVDNKESLENISENDDYLKHRPEISEKMQIIRQLWQLSPQDYFSLVSKHLFILAVKIAYQSNTVATCSPFILQFLQGRTLTLDVLQLQYFFDHPESLLMLKSIQFSIRGNDRLLRPDFSVLETILDKSQVPTVDQDCASAFEPMNEWEQNLAEKEENIKSFLNMRLNTPPDISTGYWQLSPKQYKIPLLKVHVTGTDAVDQEMLRILMEVFSASEHIELHLMGSRGFIECIRPALEQFKASFTKCSISKFELSAAEQELLLTLPSLESLEISEVTQLQDQLFPNLDKFSCLKELSVNLNDQQNVFSVIPEEFLNLHHMEKLFIRISAENGPSKLVKLIQNSLDLRVFHLKCNVFSDFESLMTVLASCKKLEEIKFSGPFFNALPFVTVLPNFISLKILNLQHQEFSDKETAEIFAYTLGSFNNLEELLLPSGDGIHQVAILIIQQCQHLQHLRVLSFFNTLDDDSVIEIAKGAVDGGFQKLEKLDLSINHKITEEGYRNFFQALDNLPNLRELTINRHFTECIRAQARTVKSLSQCVLRLPSLTRLNMLSWLLDAEDITLLTAMKERHPQSKHLTFFWKWVLPFLPVIQK